MKIDTRFDVTSLSAPSSATAADGTQNDFMTQLAAAQRNLAFGGDGETASTSTSGSGEVKAGQTETAYQTAVRELHEYLSKTPEQRMREAILKEMGLTEEDIAKLPPDEQAAIEAAIKEKIKEKLLAKADEADAALKNRTEMRS